MNWPSKKRWLAWHTAIGVFSGMMLFIICWSGTFATVSHELDWLTNSAFRSDAEQISHSQLVAAYQLVHQTLPDAEILNIETSGSGYFAINVMVKLPESAPRLVLVDPVTLQITGQYSALTISRFFRDFHMVLFNPLGVGKYLVCVFAILLLISLVSALLFYKRWWQKFLTLPSGKSARARWSSWHRWLGIWSLWFTVLIGATGSWYIFEQSRFDLLDGVFSYTDSVKGAQQPLPELVAPPDFINEARLATAIGLAEQAIPALTIHRITLNRGGYLLIAGQTQDMLVRHRANKVYIDPTTMQVGYRQTAADLDVYWRWSNTADPLHFGDFGGIYTKIIWVLFGLILSVMAASGTWMYVQRMAAKPTSVQHFNLRIAVYLGWLCLIAALMIAIVHLAILGKTTDGWYWPNTAPFSALFLVVWSAVTLTGCFWGGQKLITTASRVQ